MSIIIWGYGERQRIILQGYGYVIAPLLVYYGEKIVVETLPEWVWEPVEDEYLERVVGSQFYPLHFAEAYKLVGDQRSPSTWDGISESVALICGVRKAIRYITPPAWYIGKPDFYIEERHAPYVRFALLAVLTERLTQAFYKLDKGLVEEALALVADCQEKLNVISSDLKRPDVDISWTVALVPEERKYMIKVEVFAA